MAKKAAKKPKEPLRTFGSLFPGATKEVFKEGARKEWRVGGSGVSGSPEEAYWTRAILDLLRGCSVEVRTTGMASMCGADMYGYEARFLDGGFSVQTGPYFGGARGGWIAGPRAALFVAVGLGVKPPKRFLASHGLSTATMEELKRELLEREQEI